MDHEGCSHLLAGLSDYLDGEASAELCAEIRKHMADCNKCRVVINTLRKTVELYHRLPQPAFPEEARERLHKTLELSGYLK